MSPVPFQTIPEVLDRAATLWPDAPALEEGGRAVSFAALREQARQAARALIGRGVAPGDRVAIWAPNLANWVPAALGIHLAGAVLVPINTRYKGREAGFLLDRSEAQLLFTVDGFLGLDFVGMLDRPGLPIVRLDAGFDAFLAEGDAATPLPEVGPDDLSDVLFTSGTTGQPKGAMTTHAQTTRAFWSWSELGGLTAGDRYLVVAPFFHGFGYKAGWLAALMRGATVLPQPVFDVGAVVRRCREERVTVLPGPPALYQSMLQAGVGPGDLSVRLAITGASSIPVSLIHAMRDTLGFETVLTAYGLTESTGLATMCRPDDPPETIAKTSGRAVPGVEVRVVRPEGGHDPLPPGEVGHVIVRGYVVMQGYLGEPDKTAEAIVDGWLQTGDLGVMDAQGNLAITDRLKDLFIVGGFNAYPAEIEHILLDHPGIADVAVIGRPDARLGEVGVAFVVPSDPGLTEAAVIAWAREEMANFKVPRAVVFLDALPRNASGKVVKGALRERIATG